MVKLTRTQGVVLALTALPMLAIGAAGGYASYINFSTVLSQSASALGLVVAGEGAVFICALVSLALTLLGQHTPGTVRAGLWLVPLAASGAGAVMASGINMTITMGLTPLAMTASGEGIALVARRIVAFQSGTDLEQQRRSGLLLWHANRAANGSGLGQWLSKAAVWRLTKAFASTDSQMSVQLGEIQRYRISEGADANLAAVLGQGEARAPKTAVRPPAVIPTASAPALPAAPAEGVSEAPAASTGDGFDWFHSDLTEAEDAVAADTALEMLTVADVAELKGVKPGTVRSWVSRGNLKPAGRDESGRTLFHPLDVARMD